MDTTGFDPDGNLNELEEPLAALRPLTGNLSRDRMLFEAGRASALAVARRRFLMFSSAGMVVLVGLGLSLVRERSRRQAFEVAFARLERTQSSKAVEFNPAGFDCRERFFAIQLS